MIARKRWLFLFLFAVSVGLAFRLPALSKRPMHGDEAVHAMKFAALLQEGKYVYDPFEYHGPTLNYFTLIPAWLGAQDSLQEINEFTLRIVPVFFGILLIVLLIFLKDELGWPATIFAALFTAISPAMVFYSRYYIQEMLLASFTFGLLVFGFRYFKKKKIVWALLSGAFLGLLHATKETFVIYIAAIILALLLLILLSKSRKDKILTFSQFFANLGINHQKIIPHFIAALFVASSVSILFYSSFFTNLEGISDSILALKNYLSRAGQNDWHIHPWYFYFQRLFFFHAGSQFFSEFFILVLAFAGFCFSFSNKKSNNVLLKFFALYTLVLTAIFSLIPYKTPWNTLGFFHGLILMAGVGAAEILIVVRKKTAKTIVFISLLSGFSHLAWQSYLVNFKYEADPINPYVYAHPATDAFLMAERIKSFAIAHPDGRNTYIQFICSNDDYWPFPWYLRDFANIGWWNQVDKKVPSAPIIIISPDLENELSEKLYETPPPGERPLYIPFFEPDWQLRPGVELRGYVRKDLWDRYNQRD
jgi:uncharacterized protein (TIGR03663 family)